MIAAVLGAGGDAPASGLDDLIVPPGDDAAVFADGLVVTVDTLVEGVHFDARLSAEDVGYKAVAVSVSDLAAMGASPRWAVLALTLPAQDAAWVAGFSAGLHAALRQWGVRLAGGDTTRGPVRVVSLTLGGQVVAAPLTRAGAAPGDVLWVTGTPGLAGVGWMHPSPPAEALAALRRPQPPVDFALDLARAGLATAAMDLSDGLARDLPRLAQASGVRVAVDPGSLPAEPMTPPAVPPAAHQALVGGDDYELLFTAPAAATDAVRALARARGVRVTPIGRCETPDELGPCATLGDMPWPAPAFRHFAPGKPASTSPTPTSPTPPSSTAAPSETP